MRVVALSGSEIISNAELIMNNIGQIVNVICQNPSNPKFNHYVFETVALLIRFIPGTDITYLHKFEEMLSPQFISILQNQVAEFTPYVLQLMSQLMELSPNGAIPPSYISVLPPLLQPSPWENHGNIPALVRLMETYIIKIPDHIVSSNQLPSFLGICQKLVTSRMNDHFGFEMLHLIFDSIPLNVLEPYLVNVFGMLVGRLSSNKTVKFTRGFLKFLCVLFIKNKPGLDISRIISVFNTMQAGYFLK